MVSATRSIAAASLFLLAVPAISQQAAAPDRGPDDARAHAAFNQMLIEHATSGEEKDITRIFQRGYEAMTRMDNRAAFKSLSQTAWIQIAGDQQGHASGRMRTIAIDPTNPAIAYAGAAQGGI